MKTSSRFVIMFFVFASKLTCQPVDAATIPTVPIGNPNNPADTRYDATGVGSVGRHFRIGMTEVTNAHYTEFLNAVGASDPYDLYHSGMEESLWGGILRTGSPGNYSYAVKPDAIDLGPNGSDYSYAEKPVIFVSWFDAIRFTNWLHNDQGNGDTESGAYTLLGGGPIPANAETITRNPGARWWLPSADEWHKAAYYNSDAEIYYDYPTGTDSVPNNNLPPADSGNSANFGITGFFLTDAGAYKLSPSRYGTFDQGGNVWEWNERLFGFGDRGVRGGSFRFGSDGMLASYPATYFAPYLEEDDLGFRVATIPEPSTVSLLVFGPVLIVTMRRRQAAVCAMLFFATVNARAVTIETVPIGSPAGKADHSRGLLIPTNRDATNARSAFCAQRSAAFLT